MDVLGKKWTVSIISELRYGKPRRKGFAELKRALAGVSPKILSCRLKEMEGNGLIRKKVFEDSVPARVQYSLTNKGRDLDSVLASIREWGQRWGEIDVYDCKDLTCEFCKRENLRTKAGGK